MSSWRRAVCLAVVLAVALLGCRPASTPSSSPTPSPETDLTRPGAALRALTALQSASGAARVVKVEVTREDASVVAVTDGVAHTWAWRDGRAVEVDGDTQDVGQRSFRLSDFALEDVGALFRQAASLSGSEQRQQLQVVEYYGGDVYMTVGTTPESSTVFFRADGKPIPRLDLATVDGLRAGLADAVLGLREVSQVGYSPSQGVWADEPSSRQGTRRRVRPARFPARQDVVAARHDWLPFPPSIVRPEAVRRVLSELDPDGSRGVGVEIDRRDGLSEPTMTFTSTTTHVTDLAGNDITAQVQR